MKFQKLKVFCPSEVSEFLAYILHEEGSMGEVFDDYNNVKQVLEEKRWDYADAALFVPDDKCSVSGFFPIEAFLDGVISKITELKNQPNSDYSAVTVKTEIIDSKEWEDEWKKYYKPFNIGKIVVIPEWIDYKPTLGDVPVYLNPGLAFGTGTHETTSMCIDLMQAISVKDKVVLDFGCGSGILGLCANALGAKQVVFVDNDEQAIEATNKNIALNTASNPQVVCGDVRNITELADIVVANITADVLVDVCELISRLIKKGGYAIISGVITAKKSVVETAYGKVFTPVASKQKNEWSAYLYKL